MLALIEKVAGLQHVYQKKTFTEQGTKFLSNIYLQYKSAAQLTLLNRAFNLSFNHTLFHKDVTFLNRYFQANRFSSSFLNGIVKNTHKFTI